MITLLKTIRILLIAISVVILVILLDLQTLPVTDPPFRISSVDSKMVSSGRPTLFAVKLRARTKDGYSTTIEVMTLIPTAQDSKQYRADVKNQIEAGIQFYLSVLTARQLQTGSTIEAISLLIALRLDIKFGTNAIMIEHVNYTVPGVLI